MKFVVTGMENDKVGGIDSTGNVIGAMGGTEMMKDGLFSRLDKSLMDNFNIICSRVRDISEDKHNILWLHDTWDDPESQHLKELESRQRFKKLVFVSNYQFNTYHLAHGVQHSEAMILKNAITPIPSHDKPDPKERLNLIYHTTPHRGLELLFPVFEALYKQWGDRIHLDIYSSFNIYGWPQRDEPYKELFEACRNHPGVDYHGTVSNEEIRTALQKAHIFAYPNIWPETSCIALMEAMSAGCAIICPNHAALPETATCFANMYQMDEDPNRHVGEFIALLQAVLKAYDDERHMGKLTMQKLYADNFYSWETRIPEWESLLKKILHDEKKN